MATAIRRTSETALSKEIASLGPWFHNLHLPNGVQTFPDHWLGDFPNFKWRQIADSLPSDLSGWSCLDIGTNAGFYAFELAKRGGNVLGIDIDGRYLRQARWAAGQFGLQDRVRFECMQVYDLARLNQSFDLVLFAGVFYHLRYPMLGLDIVCQRVRRLLLFQTLTMPGIETFSPPEDATLEDRRLMEEAGWPKIAFIEHRFAGDPTNWWAPNHACCLALLRSAGMRVISQPGHEFYMCEPNPQSPSAVATWDASELLSATGHSWRDSMPASAEKTQPAE